MAAKFGSYNIAPISSQIRAKKYLLLLVLEAIQVRFEQVWFYQSLCATPEKLVEHESAGCCWHLIATLPVAVPLVDDISLINAVRLTSHRGKLSRCTPRTLISLLETMPRNLE
jgi:hypothetical protein